MKLGLGTVQFGLDYGISNLDGRTPESEVTNVLSLAYDRGVSMLDTASGYGQSEEVLGRCLDKNMRFSIVTKTPVFDTTHIGERDAKRLRSTFEDSLRKLGVQECYGLLIHSPGDLLKPGAELIVNEMEVLQKRGLVRKIGVSVYTPDEILVILQQFKIDLVQLPYNIYDQRFARSGVLTFLKQQGVEVHSRSAFLQGLFFLKASNLPSQFHQIKQHHDALLNEVQEKGVAMAHAALGYAVASDLIDVVICGVNNHDQLGELIDSAGVELECSWLDKYSIDDSSILNPSFWEEKLG